MAASGEDVYFCSHLEGLYSSCSLFSVVSGTAGYVDISEVASYNCFPDALLQLWLLSHLEDGRVDEGGWCEREVQEEAGGWVVRMVRGEVNEENGCFRSVRGG